MALHIGLAHRDCVYVNRLTRTTAPQLVHDSRNAPPKHQGKIRIRAKVSPRSSETKRESALRMSMYPGLTGKGTRISALAVQIRHLDELRATQTLQ